MKLRGIREAGFALLIIAASSLCAGQTAPPDELRQQAITLEQQGQNADAESAWSDILRADPKNAEADAHLGFLAAHRQDYAAAIPFYNKALEIAPSMPGLRLNLGLAYFKSGDLRNATRTLEPLARTTPEGSPDLQRLNVLIGTAYFGQDRYTDSIPYLQHAVAQDPQSLPLRLILVQSCLGAKKFECVKDEYAEIVKLNPDSAEADLIAGEVLDEMHDDPSAITQFQAAIKANPQLPNAHFGLGYVLWKLHRFSEASEQFQAELANVPDHHQAEIFLADCKLQLQDQEGALHLLTNAVPKAPWIELGHLDLGVLYASSGRKQDALAELKEAARIAPSDTAIHWRLARLYESLGNKSAANEELQETKQQLQKDDGSVFQQLHPTSQ